MLIKVLDSGAMGSDTPIEKLERFGKVINYSSTSNEQLKERISDADIIVLNKVRINKEALLAAKKLKLICVFATGYDQIDLKTAREFGIGVCNVPAYSTDSVTLFTVATALSLITHLTEYNDYVRSGEYTRSGRANNLVPVYHEINGKTWGIIGYGNIGRAVAKVATALGAKVIVNKRSHTPDAECVDIDELCRKSDIISIHCPLNDDTRNLINNDKIALMKKSVIIINEARGAVLCEKDIAEAIKSERIAAFGSDVYSIEPFSEEHPFFEIKNMKNVILTPHAAWGSYESRVRCIETVCQNIDSYLNGGSQNRVDAITGD